MSGRPDGRSPDARGATGAADAGGDAGTSGAAVRERRSARRDLAHARRIARVELRRSARNAREETNVLLGLALLAVFGFGGALLLSALLVAEGDGLRELDAAGRELLRVGAVTGPLVVAAVVGFRVIGETGRIDGEAGILTAVSPRAVLWGLLLAEVGRVALNVGGPLLIVVGATAVGVGPLVALALLATAVVAVLAAVPTGYLVGTTALYLSTAVGVVRRNRLTLAGVFFLGYLGVVIVYGQFAAVLAGTPLGWLADPVLLSLGAGGSPARAATAVGAAAGLSAAALAGCERLAVATWYADPAESGDDGEDAGTAVAGVDALLAPLVSRPTASVARKTLLRARRAPYTLAFALIPAFAFVGYGAQAVRAGEVGAVLPVVAAGYAGWGVGSAFTLNPFGEEGPLLPVTLTTGVSGAQFVRGRLLAAWLVAVPVVALVAVAAVVSTAPARLAALTVAFAAVFSLGSPAVSVGIGAAFPKFESRTVFASREAVMPSVLAFGAFGLALLPLGAPAVVGLLVAGTGGTSSGRAAAALALGGVALTGLACLLVGGASYWWAVLTFERYSLP